VSVSVNGIAHIQLTVNDGQRSLPFWEAFCHFLDMRTLVRNDETVYCIGSRTGVLVRVAPVDKRRRRFDQDSVGLHHFCFRARCREDVDRIHGFLCRQDSVRIVHPPEDGARFAPGYYSLLFEDPDGIRVEVNYVPGKGHFGEAGRLGPGGAGPAHRYGEAGLHDE